jgi:hypothetical protein
MSAHVVPALSEIESGRSVSFTCITSTADENVSTIIGTLPNNYTLIIARRAMPAHPTGCPDLSVLFKYVNRFTAFKNILIFSNSP